MRRGGEGRLNPLKEGWGSGKGALVTGESKRLVYTLVMTHHLGRKAARKKIFFKKKFPHMMHTSK